jgi:hypothetical protein
VAHLQIGSHLPRHWAGVWSYSVTKWERTRSGSRQGETLAPVLVGSRESRRLDSTSQCGLELTYDDGETVFRILATTQPRSTKSASIRESIPTRLFCVSFSRRTDVPPRLTPAPPRGNSSTRTQQTLSVFYVSTKPKKAEKVGGHSLPARPLPAGPS